MKSTAYIAIAFSLLIGLPASAVADSGDIVVEDAWARASIGTNRPGAAYMILRNTGSDPVTLVGLETPLAMMPEGETFPLTLNFADGGTLNVDVPILGIAARGPEG